MFAASLFSISLFAESPLAPPAIPLFTNVDNSLQILKQKKFLSGREIEFSFFSYDLQEFEWNESVEIFSVKNENGSESIQLEINKLPLAFEAIAQEKLAALYSIADDVLSHPSQQRSQLKSIRFDLVIDLESKIPPEEVALILQNHPIGTIRSYVSKSKGMLNWQLPKTTDVLRGFAVPYSFHE